MLLVTRRISAAAQHNRFQLIPMGTDVGSLSHEAASFLCKSKPLDQERDTRETDKKMDAEVFR